MEHREIEKLIEAAHNGDARAKNKIIKLMQENRYINVVSRYLYANRLLEPDDVRSEFWLGVVLALPKVNPFIGDPLFYLAWCGMKRVRCQLRAVISKGVRASCRDCNWVGRLYLVDNIYVCRKCGSQAIETHQREINITSLVLTKDQIDCILHYSEEITLHTLDIEYLRSRLTDRERMVFDILREGIVEKGKDKNYLLAIGQIMDISKQCANQYINKIRKKFEKYLREGE